MPYIFFTRQIHWICGYVLLCAVLAGSVTTSPLPAPGYVSHADKFIHAGAYAVLGLWFGQLLTTAKYWALVTSLAAFGAAIELIQFLLPHRTASVLDLLANLVGLLIAVFILRYLSKFGLYR